MKNKKHIILFFALIIFVLIYETVVHAGLLSGLYEVTVSVWRPEEAISSFMPWMLAGQILLAIVFGVLYCCSQCRTNIVDGAKFGMLIGLLLGATSLVYYAVLPIPLSLLIAWLGFGLLETILMGIISAFIMSEKK